MENKVLVIAGMHRSGTSLITQWLYKCGLQVGDELMAPGIGNEEGHFEDMDFIRAHCDVLDMINQPTDGFLNVEMPPVPEAGMRRLEAVIQQKNEANKQWGWKDPRTCLFLPAYRELLPDARYLIIVRDFQSSVSSAMTRLHKEIDALYASKSPFKRLLWKVIEKRRRKKLVLRKQSAHCLRVWVLYNEALLQHIQALPPEKYLVVDHAMLGKCDYMVLNRLQKDWQFSLRYCPFNDVYKPSLISNVMHFQPYVRDKQLLTRAMEVEKSLRALIA